jgi:hypothetical protein
VTSIDSPDQQDPRSASPFNFQKLTKDEWEELTFLLAHRENDKVVRLRAPDGGLDTLLPSTDRPGKADRGWQAKHFPKEIRWDQCEESLDRAVQVWEPKHITFTFPHDLTSREHKNFQKHLVGRHKGVTVDYWAEGKMSADLLADDAGSRITNRFFGRKDPVEIMERAMRSGGDLSRPEHVLEREFAIDEYVDSADPHFQWVIHKLGPDDPEPEQSPGAVMRLEFRKGDSRLLADAVPRGQSSAENYGPKVTLITDDSKEGAEARRLLGELLGGIGRLRLREGLKIAMERVPKPFGDLISEPFEGEVLIKAVPNPAPWFMTIEVSSTLGEASMDLDLQPGEPSEDWDSEWRGSRGSLTLQIQTRWLINEGRGETSLRFDYSSSEAAPLSDRSLALGVMVALHGEGTMRFVDRTGEREALEQPLGGSKPKQELIDASELVSALLEIEKASGRKTPPMPEKISLKELDGIVLVGEHLRQGGILYRMKNVKMTGDNQAVAQLSKSGADIEVKEDASVMVFGEEIPVARRIIKLPYMTTKEVTRIRGKEDLWEIVLVPLEAEEVEVWAEMKPLTAEDENPD